MARARRGGGRHGWGRELRVVFAVVVAFGWVLGGVRVSASRAVTLARGPYLQTSSPTAIVVRWRTDVAAPSRVRYGMSPTALDAEVSEPVDTRYHEIRLDGLSPGSRYYYSVETFSETLAGHDNDHFFDLPPVSGTRTPVRVLVLGDAGHFERGDIEGVRDAYYAYDGGNRQNMVLLLGDNAYDVGTDDEYQQGLFDPYKDLLRNTVVWPTRGNHDRVRSGSNNDIFDFFTLPESGEAGGVPSGSEAYYSFDYANVHFICLDSEGVSRSAGGAMMTWLRDDISATDQDWIVAFFHHPPYTKSNHDSDDPVDSGGRMEDMRTIALPILEAGGVDLVLNGHSHSYERSYLLNGHYGDSSTLDPSMILSTDPGYYEKPALDPVPNSGTVYVVLGSSSLLVEGGNLDHPAMATSHFRLGFVVVEVNANRLDAVFVDDGGIERDRFAIVKGVGGGNNAPVAGFSASPDAGVGPLDVDFDASDSSDPDGDALTYEWNFGDGATASGVTVAHTYADAGAFEARLTVRDKTLSDTTTRTITVTEPPPPNRSPVASFVAIPAVGPVPLEVSLDASGSSDPDGDLLSYAWDFGDGTTGDGVSTSHTYDEVGEFEVLLTVGDGELTDSMTRTVVAQVEPDPLELTLGVLQNPYLPQFIDVFLVSSEALNPATVSVTAGSDDVPMTLIDEAANVWKGDYEITASGELVLQGCASSSSGLLACTSKALTSQFVSAGRAAVVTSPDGVLTVRIGEGAAERDAYVLIIPDAHTGDVAVVSRGAAIGMPVAGEPSLSSFSVGPRDLTSSGPVSVEFSYNSLTLPPDVLLSQLYIGQAGVGALPSRIDDGAGVVRARATELGRFSLAVGAPGTTPTADSRFARLLQNYPNPFNPSTTIPFEVQTRQRVRVSIYDVAGHRIATLLDAEVPAGLGHTRWDGRATDGSAVVSGVYFARLETPHATASRRLLLVR